MSIGNKYAVGDMGGEDFHVLTIDEMPAHTHGNTFNASGPHNVGSNGNGQFGNTGSTGGNQPHENRPPYYALAFIMKQ